MDNVRASSTRAAWLMVSVVLVALNLRPSMAAVGPLLSAIRGNIPLSFSAASLLTMLPVIAMGLAMFLGMRIAQRFGEHRTIVLSFEPDLALDHLDNPRRAGGLTAFVQGIGYLIAGLSPLMAGVIRDRLGSFEWAWWSLTAVMAAMIVMVPVQPEALLGRLSPGPIVMSRHSR